MPTIYSDSSFAIIMVGALLLFFTIKIFVDYFTDVDSTRKGGLLRITTKVVLSIFFAVVFVVTLILSKEKTETLRVTVNSITFDKANAMFIVESTNPAGAELEPLITEYSVRKTTVVPDQTAFVSFKETSLGGRQVELHIPESSPAYIEYELAQKLRDYGVT